MLIGSHARVFDKLIWHTIGPKSFLFGTAQFSLWASGAVNYDYIVTNSINSMLIGSHARVLYGTPLAQRASYLALHSSLFGPVAQLIMIILSLTALTLC